MKFLKIEVLKCHAEHFRLGLMGNIEMMKACKIKEAELLM